MKEIVLTQGLVTIVDDECFERFGKFKWHTIKDGRNYYAGRNAGFFPCQKKQLLHREILSAPEGMDTDHINGNGLDNRRENLRLCTKQENNFNKRHIRNGKSSQFKGVCWDGRNLKWHARIQVDGREISLGRFYDEYEAARSYDTAARKLFGDFAAPNFI